MGRVTKISDKEFIKCMDNIIKYYEVVKTGFGSGIRYITNNVFCLSVSPDMTRLYNIDEKYSVGTNTSALANMSDTLIEKAVSYFRYSSTIEYTHCWITYSKRNWKELKGRTFKDYAYFELNDQSIRNLENNYYCAIVNSKLLKNVLGLVLEDANSYQLGFNPDNKNDLIYIKVKGKIVGLIAPIRPTKDERKRKCLDTE